MSGKHEFQPDEAVRVYGMPELTHANGGNHGMQVRRPFRTAKIMRRDEQHGRGQWRVLYSDTLRQDVVSESRLEPDPDAEDAA